MYNFEHEPEQQRLAERYSIARMMPSACAAELTAGTAEIGLIPTGAYTPELAVIPGCTIASMGAIRSILLVSRRAPEDIRSVALDTSSRTSALYTQILFRTWWNPAATFVAHAPELDAMLRVTDAALLIGDPALHAIEAPARPARQGLIYYDLGLEWQQRTGVPWVSAFWAARAGAIPEPAQVTRDFQDSRDAGLAHIPQLVAEWAPRLRLPEQTVREYLTGNIHYQLDAACLAGIEHFYRRALDCRLIPSVPAITLL